MNCGKQNDDKNQVMHQGRKKAIFEDHNSQGLIVIGTLILFPPID